MEDLFNIAMQFGSQGTVVDVEEFGNGHINRTFLVTLDSEKDTRFILQNINTRVFRRPELVMSNLLVSTEHARRRLTLATEERQWKVPRVFFTKCGKDHYLDSKGSFWRAISFIEDTRSFDTIKDDEHAREVGYALGMFHALLSDLPADRLSDTLEGFHITPLYLRRYDEVLAGSGVKRTADADYCMKFICERREWANVLENAKREGDLLSRPIHGDPKVNNILMDNTTGKAVSIVDLDTVKPGLVHYDIGDCLRSCCNQEGETPEDLADIRFDTDLCRSVLQGYLSIAGRFLTSTDFDYLYDAVRLISFELGLRFFTDYLESDVYFRVKYPGQNLLRAVVQFRLTESIEAQEPTIRNIIRDLR